MTARAKEVLDKVGLKRKPGQLVEEISISEKQQCEIAKALISNADVIIMDEPTSSLTTSETAHLFEIIRQLKAEGKGIVYISHKMDEIKEIGDVITVLKLSLIHIWRCGEYLHDPGKGPQYCPL